jgi:hypothetical protein
MPKTKLKIGDREVETWYEYPALIPEEWVMLVRKLHPVTAIVVWEVLNNRLSPETIRLAQSSPDWERYTAIRIVGGGNVLFCEEVAELARGEMEEIFENLIPGYAGRRTLH